MLNHPQRDLSNDESAEIERNAFNAAFYELGLRWYWDIDTYRALSAHADPGSRVRSYLQSEQAHMLRAYDAGFLSNAILAVKQRCERALAKCSSRSVPQFSWADARCGEVGF